jgi:hypothetical protein
MLSFLSAFLLCAAMGSALMSAEIQWKRHPLGGLPGIAGAAYETGRNSRLIVWGQGVWERSPGRQNFARLRQGSYQSGACLFDVNRDGHADLVVIEAPDRMMWLAGPSFASSALIDSEASFIDCLGVTLFGRRGVVVVHQGMQVRFYEAPREAGGRWEYRELYSFYTASYQGGLLLEDIDGDGRPDLVCGNYWIRAPESWERHWSLFAINTYHEAPQAANMQQVILPGGLASLRLLASQREMTPARVVVFHKPDHAESLWREQRLEGSLGIRRPRAFAAADFDNDGLLDFALGENHASGARLWWWRQEGGGAFAPRLIHRGPAVRRLLHADWNSDGRADLVAIGESIVSWWENQPLQ